MQTYIAQFFQFSLTSSSDRRRRRSVCSLASWGAFGMHAVLTYIDLAGAKSEALGNI